MVSRHDMTLLVKHTFCFPQVEEGVQYGIISSNRFHVFFKRELPPDGKSVVFSDTFECISEAIPVRQLYLYILHLALEAAPVPPNKHSVTPEEDKLLHPDGKLGSSVPGTIVAQRIASSASGQPALKRPSESSVSETGGSDLQ